MLVAPVLLSPFGPVTVVELIHRELQGDLAALTRSRCCDTGFCTSDGSWRRGPSSRGHDWERRLFFPRRWGHEVAEPDCSPLSPPRSPRDDLLGDLVVGIASAPTMNFLERGAAEKR